MGEARARQHLHAAGDRACVEKPTGWDFIEADGYAIHVDHELEDPKIFAAAVEAGLCRHVRTLPCRFLYDARGSELYEKLIEQPEYYLPRAESEILERYGAALRAQCSHQRIVELGSGNSARIRLLLRSFPNVGGCGYTPIDISWTALETTCKAVVREYPALHVEAIASSFDRALPLVHSLSPLLLVFLGSTVGNLDDDELRAFLDMVSDALKPGDHFLLGVDAVKDAGVLEAAYNDAAGWTARFTCNYFRRMNAELGTDIPLGQIEHVALYNERLERIEIYARFCNEVTISSPLMVDSHRIVGGEMILTEISRKFQPVQLVARLRRHGLETIEILWDEQRQFALLLARRVQRTATNWGSG